MSRPPRPDIVQDLSLLYELSLAVGTSLHLETNCDTFLKTLLARKNLDYAAVWVRDPYPNASGKRAGYRLVYANPTVRRTTSWLPATHPVAACLETQAFFTVTNADPAFAQYITEEGITGGTLALFTLGDLGLLKLHAHGPAQFEAREMKQLLNVFAKFATSLEGCLSHQQLLDEIRERRRTEREIVRLKNFYEQVLDGMPAQLAVFDIDGRYVYVNPSAVSDPERRRWIVGKTNEEYCQARGLDPAIGRKRSAALRKAVEQKEVLRFEEIFPGPDGLPRHYMRVVSPVMDTEGRMVRILGFGFDVTERKQAREALHESEARKGAILASALDGIVTFDEAGRILEFNPAAEAIFGYAREKLLGQSILEYFVPPDLRDAYRHGVKDFLKAVGGRFGERIEISGLRADGTTFPVEMALMPARLDDGRRLYTVYVRDITERKKAENELLKAHELARQSVKAKELFLANMSHEMRTPLNAVIGMTHLLQQTHPTTEQARYLNAIKFSADNLLVLINDVLDFARIESGKIVFEDVPFRLPGVLRGLIDTVSVQAEAKGLELALHRDSGLPHLLIGDPIRLHQILLNLLGNAIKFTEAGQVCLSVSPGEREGNRVFLRFAVTDTGIGIPPDKLGCIFNSFTQAYNHTRRIYGGAGLGLAIVKELVDGLGGDIRVESREQQGSCFIVTLPFVEVEEETYGPPAPVVALDGVRILVVEDNEMNQFVMQRMLESWGVRVDLAPNGRAALECLQRATYDLVLMDIQMPEMDGYETTRRIREQLALPAEVLPVLALTASTLVEKRDEIEAAGMNDFILKPFDPDDLRARITLHLNLRPAPKPVSARQYVNLSFLEEHAFGKNDFIVRMIDLFMAQVPTLLEQLKEALATEDWGRVKFVAHKMQASAGMMGIEALKTTLQTVEGCAAEETHLDQLPDWVEKAEEVCRVALQELLDERRRYA